MNTETDIIEKLIQFEVQLKRDVQNAIANEAEMNSVKVSRYAIQSHLILYSPVLNSNWTRYVFVQTPIILRK